MERMTVPDKRIDEHTTGRTAIDANKVREHAMDFYLALKRYEDTGLEPEGIVALTRHPDFAIADYYKSLGLTMERITELAQADKEGRCVVQRFSPGQTVWVIERDEDGEAYDLSDYVFVTSLRGIALVSPKINGSSEIDAILMDQVESRINYSDGCIEAYTADDCYLTREAAEKAIGGGGDD